MAPRQSNPWSKTARQRSRSLLIASAMLCLVGVSSAAGVPAEVGPADQEAIRGVIRAQIEAFQRDDGDAAFALASPSIQHGFGTPQNFMRMVRSGYQAVYRPRRYQFTALEMMDGQLFQKLIVIGPDGLAVMALYPMVRVEDGSWKTDGCYLVPLASKDA